MNREITDNLLAWGDAHKGLRAGIALAPNGHLRLILENTSKSGMQVYSHVSTHERHYDWFHIVAVSTTDGSIAEISLLDSRDRSAPIIVTLAPGSQIVHDIDFADWSHRHGHHLTPGIYRLSFTYEVHEAHSWHGKLKSGSITLQVDAAGGLMIPQ